MLSGVCSRGPESRGIVADEAHCVSSPEPKLTNMTYPIPDEHDDLIDAHAALVLSRKPTARDLCERTGVSAGACQTWLNPDSVWPPPDPHRPGSRELCLAWV